MLGSSGEPAGNEGFEVSRLVLSVGEKKRMVAIPDLSRPLGSTQLHTTRQPTSHLAQSKALNYPASRRRSGGIGRRAGLRIPWGDPCRFKSCLLHYLILLRKIADYIADGRLA